MTAPLTVFRSDGWLGVSGAGIWLLTNAPADDPIVEGSCALVRDGAELHQLVAAFTARSDLAYTLVGVVGDVTQVVVRGPVRAEIATTRETQVFAGAPDGGDWSGYVVTDPTVGVTLVATTSVLRGSASATSAPLGVIGRPGEQAAVAAHPPAVTPPAVTPTPMRWVHEPPAIAEPPPHQPDSPVMTVAPPTIVEPPAIVPADTYASPAYEPAVDQVPPAEEFPPYPNDGALPPDSFESSGQSGPWHEPEMRNESAHSAEPIDVEPIDVEPVSAEPVSAELVNAEPVDADPIDMAPSTSWSSQPTSVMPLVSAPPASDAASNGSRATAGDERAPEPPTEWAPSEALPALPLQRGAAGLISDVSWADDLASTPTQPAPSSPAPARALDDMSWTSEQSRSATPDSAPLAPSGPVTPTLPAAYTPPPAPDPPAPETVYPPPQPVPSVPSPVALDYGSPAVSDYGSSVPVSLVASEPPQRPWFAPEEPFGNTTTR